jgi:hypothetical protein
MIGNCREIPDYTHNPPGYLIGSHPQAQPEVAGAWDAVGVGLCGFQWHTGSKPQWPVQWLRLRDARARAESASSKTQR